MHSSITGLAALATAPADRTTISMQELLASVGGLTLTLIAVFLIWRYRRLKLRRGGSELEYFPDVDGPNAKR